MRVLALSSGTSVDAIDVALADFDLGAGPGTVVLTPLGHLELSWEHELRGRILGALPPAELNVGQWCDLDTEIGQAFAQAATTGLARLGAADLVVSHGQTLFHRVSQGRVLGTLQVGQPAWIHAATGLPVISDLRSADVAAGGHGAPLVSLLDQLWLGQRPTAVLNIGGIANLTLVGAGRVITGDTGPGNCLIDAATAHIGQPCDLHGARAAAGEVDQAALQALLDEPYYRQDFPRSTGREHFHRDYVADRLAAAGVALPQGDDLFATLTELTAQTIADAAGTAERLVISGGGAHNPTLISRLSQLAGPVTTTTELGLDADAKEAYLFALLGYLSAHGLPGTAPANPAEPHGVRATGAGRPAVLGSLTPPAALAHLSGHTAQTPITSLVIGERTGQHAPARPETPHRGKPSRPRTAAPTTPTTDLQNVVQGLLDQATKAALDHGGAPRAEPLNATAGAEALLAHRGEVIAHARSGMGSLFAKDGSLLPATDRDRLTGDHLWDIASITKLVVAAATLVQVDRGSLDLAAAVVDYLPQFGAGSDGAAAPGARRGIRVRQLLTHTAGLPAVTEPWKIAGDRAARADYLLTRPLEHQPGSAHVYSCTGYIVLGLLLEQVTGASLPQLIAETVTGPLGMESTGYTPAAGRPVAATEYDTKLARGLVRGQVHDETAAALGGSGNAGLFCDAADLLAFGEEIRTGAAALLSEESRALLSAGTLWPEEVARLGYDQALGCRLGQEAFMGTTDPAAHGHTGFVGTSLMVDPRHDLVVVLLTNRVHPHREAFTVMPLRRAVAEAGRRWTQHRFYPG